MALVQTLVYTHRRPLHGFGLIGVEGRLEHDGSPLIFIYPDNIAEEIVINSSQDDTSKFQSNPHVRARGHNFCEQ